MAHVDEQNRPNERILDFKGAGRGRADRRADRAGERCGILSLGDESFRRRFLSGASFTAKSLIQRNGETLVRKEARGHGREKLINEISWLLQLPAALRRHFPVVRNYQLNASTVFYDMEFYPFSSLSDLILEGVISSEEVLRKVTRVLTFYVEKVIAHGQSPSPGDYAVRTMIPKIRQRLDETRRESPEVFTPLTMAASIYVNGKRYRRNIPCAAGQRRTIGRDQKVLQPPYLTLVHGDLHFGNMLTPVDDDEGFILLDNRGDLRGDPMYDIAKILHTVIGKYDMLYHDLQTTTVMERLGEPAIDVIFPSNHPAWRVYQSLEDKIFPLLERLLRNVQLTDPEWLLRALFTHAALFPTSCHSISSTAPIRWSIAPSPCMPPALYS